jgi:hypothetical protein
MKLITKNSELFEGDYYHCFEKKAGHYSIEKCASVEGNKYLGEEFRYWAMGDNNQALRKFNIIGPIPVPLELITMHDKINQQQFIIDSIMLEYHPEETTEIKWENGLSDLVVANNSNMSDGMAEIMDLLNIKIGDIS